MKRVVSVSLGSSRRNHSVQVMLLGEPFEIRRIGTDGNINKAISILKELDGQVDAIGLGGIDVYVYAGAHRYVLQDGLRMLEAVKSTPVVDGSGLKNTLERQAVAYLAEQGLLTAGTKVLLVSAMDRFGMAEALERAGCRLTLGDLMFALGIKIPLYSLNKLQRIAAGLMPIISRLPFQLLYPTGQQQEKNHQTSGRLDRYYLDAEVIAGDYHFIRKHLPAQLNGQMILTNTTTREDVEELLDRGAGTLVTTTPEFQGRTFGTNVMEAVFLALLEKSWGEVTPEDYAKLLAELKWQPKIIKLNQRAGSNVAVGTGV